MGIAPSLAAEVRDVFANVTRYPADILDLEADLEDDLGIDSVKLGEIFSVLREKYRLPDKIDIAPEKLKTIGGISASLQQYLSSAPRSDRLPSAQPTPVVAAGNGARPTIGREAVLAHVREVFAEVTRYPIEILDVDASLEDDLGIDSVKLGEIFSVLREQYHLPEKLDIPVHRLKTIAGIGDALHEYLSAARPEQQLSSAQRTTPAVPGNGASQAIDRETVSAGVRQVFADVTRYPPEILDPDASLEEDLGIDSVKLGEVFSVLRERYQLPEKLDVPAEKLKTIGSISDALEDYLSARESSAPITQERILRNAVPPVSQPTRGGAGAPAIAAAAAHDRRSETFAALTPELKPFLGKVAFISGSGRGLGKDIAVYLGELGATVVVNSFHSRNSGDETAEQIKAAGGDALHLWGSMANPAQVQRMFDDIEARYHTLDFFISNASNGMLAPVENLTVEHWEKAFRTNVVGLHQGALRAASMMKKSGGGKIITLSSPAAHGYVEYFGCMGAVKAAVESLTRALAIEFAPYNIQVNCVSPGPIDGELLRKWPDSKRLIDEWTAATPQRRLCEHRDVSHFIAYLLSEPVKAFTGSVLVLDAGISSQGW
jgi:NAD(P)-dependent dehydrogenase (short-subunit alcohol dehydrogenase family)/acyl carrier protein